MSRVFTSRILIPASALLLCHTSCKPRAYNSKPKSLEEMQRQKASTPMPGFALGFAQDKKIPHQVFRDTLVVKKFETEADLDKYLRDAIRIEFGKLSEAQYDLLMGRFGGQKLVPWDANRTTPYAIEDFLHPKIQAYSGRWLHTTTLSAKGIPDSWRTFIPGEPLVETVGNDMNCWTTAYDVIRDWWTPVAKMKGIIGFYDGRYVTESLKNSKYFDKVLDLSANEAWGNTAAWNKGRQVGDLLFIENPNLPESPGHLALWLDNDLYFEKTNGGDTEPIRLTHISDILGLYPKHTERVSFYRIKAGATPPSAFDFQKVGENLINDPLPPPWKGTLTQTMNAGLFGGSTGISLNNLIEFNIMADGKTNRASFIGADNLLNFVQGERVCWSTETFKGTYTYQISSTGKLSVRNASGKEVAALKGTESLLEQDTEGQKAPGVVKFPAGGKTLALNWQTDKFGATTILLSHPGVSDEISMQCARNPNELFKGLAKK